MSIPILNNEDELRKYVSENLLMNYDACRIDFLIGVSKTIGFSLYLVNFRKEKLKEKIFDFIRIKSN